MAHVSEFDICSSINSLVIASKCKLHISKCIFFKFLTTNETSHNAVMQKVKYFCGHCFSTQT